MISRLFSLTCWLVGGGMLLMTSALAFARQAPPQSPYLVYSAEQGGDYNIYRMRTDGRDHQQLTMHSGYDGDPTWSPDGSTVAFVSDRLGTDNVYSMNSNGKGMQSLTNATSARYSNWGPRWSRSGEWIVYQVTQTGIIEIYGMQPDGEGKIRMTFNSGHDLSASWAPNDDWIVVESRRDRQVKSNLYLVGMYGEGMHRLTTDERYKDSMPMWSPDGNSIAFKSEWNRVTSIYVVNPDGGDLRLLVSNTDNFMPPMWSSDSEWIAYAAHVDPQNTDENPNYDIFRVNIHDGTLINVTNSPNTNDWRPVWSPNDEWIAFVSSDDFRGDYDIHRIRADGSQRQNLTQSPARYQAPEWAPIRANAWGGWANGGFGALLIGLGFAPNIWRKRGPKP